MFIVSEGWHIYILQTRSPQTTTKDLVHGLPSMDHPEICGKHKFNNARTLTKDATEQTRLPNICDVTLVSDTS